MTIKKLNTIRDPRFLLGLALSLCLLSGCRVDGGAQDFDAGPVIQANFKTPWSDVHDKVPASALATSAKQQSFEEPLSAQIWAFVKMDRADLWRGMNESASTR